jgi:hypothetical protein
MRKGILAAVCLVVLVLGCGTATAAEPPANDDFAAAQMVSGSLPLDLTGTTVGATREVGEPIPPQATPSGHSVWFRWEAPTTGYVSIGACGSEQRENLGVYTGSAVSALAEVASTRFSTAPDCDSNNRSVNFTAHAGTVYSIAVEGDAAFNEYLPWQSGEGPIELHLSRPAPPANDDLTDAEPIEERELSYRFDNFGATREPGEPDHRGEAGGASVWFKWTATHTGGVAIQACPGEIGKEAVLAVYTGSTLATLTPAASLQPFGKCGFTFFAFTGVSYSIAVDGVPDPKSGTAAMFEAALSVHRIPQNDDFEDARSLAQPPFGGAYTSALLVGSSNVGATKQAGEPNHAGNAGGASIWFTWTAPEDGSVQMSACEGTFPTLLAVYTGSSLGALTPVTSGTSASTESCPINAQDRDFGEVGFNTVAGTVYAIAVDGVDGALGHFNLDLWASEEPQKPRPAPAAAPAPAQKPRVTIVARHIDQRHRRAVFNLRSTLSGTRFRCKLDYRAFVRCGAKVTYRHLAPGHHVFRALAVGQSATRGAPAKAGFVIRRSR